METVEKLIAMGGMSRSSGIPEVIVRNQVDPDSRLYEALWNYDTAFQGQPKGVQRVPKRWRRYGKSSLLMVRKHLGKLPGERPSVANIGRAHLMDW